MVEKVAIEQGFLWKRRFFSASFITPMQHTSSSSICSSYRKDKRSKPANLCSPLFEVRKHWIERYLSLSKLLCFNKCWNIFQVLSCFRVLRVEVSWYELHKRFPLSLNSIKFLPKSCAVTLTRKQTLAVLFSRDSFYYPYVFMFSILLWQGSTGKAWESFTKWRSHLQIKMYLTCPLSFPFAYSPTISYISLYSSSLRAKALSAYTVCLKRTQ